ncbi:uncharacterized protein LOC110861068 [Folsomia candida]|uniref:THAP-type domain-containing protein n=1 Tax=Folsomia candida TaxID=158441 RepID=A0A226D3U1_FOLCA|nr:uncharacterized protein LOC110861068 [Folsomia candida]XP_035716764.1 uncharacterized protein LOC110861068 [Folsomia candida]OXA39730.1 hypothetical protein Fcan01_25598 [Folsomia candida]
MTKSCCIDICGSSGRDAGISFFSFPKDPASAQAWCDVLGITLNPSEISKPHLCHLHFAPSSYTTKSFKSLIPGCLPVTVSQNQEPLGPISSNQTEQIKTGSDLQVTAEDSLMSIISKQRREIQELKKTNKLLQDKIRYSKSKRQKLDYATILDSFPGNESFAQFVNTQFERYNEKIHSRWSDKEKTLAVSLHSRLSLKGYSWLLEMGFKLPPVTTVSGWVGKIPGSPAPRRVGRPSVSKSGKKKKVTKQSKMKPKAKPAAKNAKEKIASEDIMDLKEDIEDEEDDEDDESMEDEEGDEKKYESDHWQEEWLLDNAKSGKEGHYY